MCSVAPEDDQLPLVLSFWCSIDLPLIFFFVRARSKLYSKSKLFYFFLIFGPIFGIQGKVIVCFLLMLLLLLLLVPCVLFLKLLIIFCNVFLSCPFLQNISVRCSISLLKYFSEKIFVALARNPLNMLVIV